MKYTDPDGREDNFSEFWEMLESCSSGSDKLFFNLIKNACTPHDSKLERYVDMDAIITNLTQIPYISSENQSEIFITDRGQYFSFTLETNNFENSVCASPQMKDATLADTVNIEGSYGAVILFMGICGKMMENKIGDISFKYKISNGRIIAWTISKRTTDSINIFDINFTKTDAIEYLNKNKDKFYENKDFKNLSCYLD